MLKGLPSHDVIGGVPDQHELDRLVENYPSYELPHRDALLNGYFQGWSLKQLIDAKLKAKGLVRSELSPHSLGGHGHWAVEKVKKTLVRILYLRYRIDEGLTRRKADHRLLPLFWSEKALSDAGRSALRKMTQGAKVDAISLDADAADL